MSKAKKTNKKAIQKPTTGALAERPVWAEESLDEQMDQDELLLPRIEVAQALSPQLDEAEPNYIPGLKQGDLFNTATGEKYGKSLQFVSVVYRKEFLVFQDREQGGGFGGTFNTSEEALAAIENLDGDGWEPIMALSNLVMILNDDSSVKEVAYLSCTKTKIKVAKKMNTYLQMVQAARYATVFELGTTKEDGQRGSYFNFTIHPQGWLADRDVYEEAKKLHDQMKGKTVTGKYESNDSKEF